MKRPERAMFFCPIETLAGETVIRIPNWLILAYNFRLGFAGVTFSRKWFIHKGYNGKQANRLEKELSDYAKDYRYRPEVKARIKKLEEKSNAFWDKYAEMKDFYEKKQTRKGAVK
jgi:hypothetical protein